MNSIECGGVRTVVEVWDCLQHMAIGVESFWPTDSTREVLVRVQNDLGINEVAGGDSLVQSLAKRNGGGHVCDCWNRALLVVYHILTISDPKRVGDSVSYITWSLDPGDLELSLQ